jgi:hypothetical protein
MTNRIYQNAFNAPASNSQVSIDRARGGQIQITLTIPSKNYKVRGGLGSVTTDEMQITFEIDLEEMPLVNVASYKTDRTQTGPKKMDYPNGNISFGGKFS